MDMRLDIVKYGNDYLTLSDSGLQCVFELLLVYRYLFMSIWFDVFI